MIEFPEALIIARQMAAELDGRTIVRAQANASPHKFAFYTGAPETYPERLQGVVLGPARANGNMIYVPVGPSLHLILGEGGERILLHAPGASLPAKHQLWLTFDDGRQLTVSIQGWGFVGLMDPETLAAHPYAGRVRPSPLADEFSLELFRDQFAALPGDDARSIKAFLVSDPGVHGIGNGCLQDILFHARLHPRTPAAQLSPEQQQTLYRAVREALTEMVELGGRDSELDLYGRTGGYARLLHSKVVGQPCPVCGVPIEKQSFLGGSVYFCPVCQPEPSRKKR